MRHVMLFSALLALVSCSGQESSRTETGDCCAVTIEAIVPEGTGTVYLSGNLPVLGPWEPDALAMKGEGTERTAEFHAAPGTELEYKFTLGTWDNEALGD